LERDLGVAGSTVDVVVAVEVEGIDSVVLVPFASNTSELPLSPALARLHRSAALLY
jgi:hypothetical protein